MVDSSMNFMAVVAYDVAYGVAYSKNKKALSATGLVAGRCVGSGRQSSRSDREYANKGAALRAFFGKVDAPGDFGEQGVIATDADVVTRVHARAALTHDDAAGGDEFTAKSFNAQAF
jgi:hypothetical protein